ncbi:hypothetical protein ACFQ0B_39070 [Nonomuraea thailandensis]
MKSSPTVEAPDDGEEPPPSGEPAPQWRCRDWIAAGSGVEMAPCLAVVGDTLHIKGQIRGRPPYGPTSTCSSTTPTPT